MKGDKIQYQNGYKYQLYATYAVQLDICPVEDIVTDFILLGKNGNLTIMSGYAWDGASGPVVQTADTMRGSLVHDALYQLMRGGYLDEATWRERADNALRSVLLEDGMTHFRAEYFYLAVQNCGNPSADPRHNKPILEAP